jgi:hypothetical protein
MAIAPLSRLIDHTIKEKIEVWWGTGIAAPQWQVGEGYVEFPSFHTKIINSQEMEWKGNYIVDVESRLLSSLKTEGQDSYTYEGMVDNHHVVAARMEEFFSVLDTTDLEQTITGYSNSIEKVYEIKLLDYYADLDEGDMVLEHKWTLAIMLFQGYQ